MEPKWLQFCYMRKVAILLAILAVGLCSNSRQNPELKPLSHLSKTKRVMGECESCEEKNYSDSSRIKLVMNRKEADLRAVKLRRFLEARNSPLAEYAEYIVRCADRYRIDWRLVPAITGIESSFAILNAAPYNAYGWAGGRMAFGSWEESIEIVTRSLRENYINRGADTVGKIAPIYCPPNYIKWTGAVTNYMRQIEATSVKIILAGKKPVDLSL